MIVRIYRLKWSIVRENSHTRREAPVGEASKTHIPARSPTWRMGRYKPLKDLLMAATEPLDH